MNVSSKSGYFVDLYDLFPRTVGSVWQPFVTVAPLGNPLKGQVVLHEEEVIKFQMQQMFSDEQSSIIRVGSLRSLPL